MTVQETAAGAGVYAVSVASWAAWAIRRRVPATMKWALVWYIPVSALALAVSVFSLFGAITNTLALATQLGKAALGLLLSPNAWTWLAAGLIPAVYPWFVFRRKITGTAVSFAAMVVITCAAWVLAWGSYPITHSGNAIYIRDWPFAPWPDYPLL